MPELIDMVRPFLEERQLITTLLASLALFFVLIVVHLIVRRLFYRIVSAFSSRMPPLLREIALEKGLYRRLSLLVVISLFYQGINFVPHLPESLTSGLKKLAILSLIIVGIGLFTLLSDQISGIYSRYQISRSRPIKGYLQVASIILYILGFVLCVATLLDRSPLVFLSGLGALTAIILLAFRDTLLSFVAGIQLTTNNLIQVGDWIEMPQFEANGDVIDIALHVVKVQNWDKTITVIPTHKFLEHSFKNWRGMHESGGRRIKRCFNVDMNTIRFLDKEQIEHFSRFLLLQDYMAEKVSMLTEHNAKHAASGVIANSRHLTNVGTFRAYIAAYLRQHPMVNKNMTFLVRQLQPTPEGLPIEIYVFSTDTRWAIYEGVQADIFDHVLAIASEFGLRVYQRPSGRDIHEAALGLRGEDLSF